MYQYLNNINCLGTSYVLILHVFVFTKQFDQRELTPTGIDNSRLYTNFMPRVIKKTHFYKLYNWYHEATLIVQKIKKTP